MPSIMPRQRRPSGPMWSIDDEWKRDVLAIMERKQITQADLARTLGVSPSMLSMLFQGSTRQTRLKPAIHRALGLVQPTATPAVDRDEIFNRLLHAWKGLSDEQREVLIKTAELLSRK